MRRTFVAAPLLVAGMALLLEPILAGTGYASTAATGSAVIGALMIVAAIGLAFASLEFWSGVALGIGAWAFVAPMLLGFERDVASWLHIFAGFTGILTGVAGHELPVSPSAADRPGPTAGLPGFGEARMTEETKVS